MRPYIGITDFMTADQVKKMLGAFNSHKRAGSQRQLHVGVMMSHKTLHNKETRFVSAFPRKEDICKIFFTNQTMNCLHYVDYVGEPSFVEDLSSAISYGGSNLHAVQLDMVWPDPRMLLKVLFSIKRPEIILQIGQKAFEQVHDDPVQVVAQLTKYEGLVQRVLLDRSMGMGKILSPGNLIPFIIAIKKALPQIGIAVAGGLGPSMLDVIIPLVERYPDISIDAQGRLRPSGSNLEPVNWDMARSYLWKALDIFES